MTRDDGKPSATHPEDAIRLLQNATLEDVQKEHYDNNVVTLRHDCSVGEAMRSLAMHGILSAPVIIEPDLEDLGELRVDSPRTQLIGWVDTNDIVTEFLRAVGGKVLHEQKMLHNMTVLEQQGPRFAEKKLITIMGGRDRSLVYHTNKAMPLLEAIRKYFVQEGEAGPVHRIALFDQTGEITAIVSQMDVMRYLVRSRAAAAWASTSLEAAGFISPDRPVSGVDINSPTLKALQRMQERGHSATAVLSADGKLITNISSSDLRYLQPDHLSVLALPLGEFLGLLHGAVYLGQTATGAGAVAHKYFAKHRDRHPVPLITCRADASIMHAMVLMVEHHVHRVYIVDDDTADQPTPLAVVCPTDILKYLVRL